MGFKPQRGKFTPDLAVENPELFRVSNPNGVNLHENGVEVSGGEDLEFQTPTG